MERHYEENL